MLINTYSTRGHSWHVLGTLLSDCACKEYGMLRCSHKTQVTCWCRVYKQNTLATQACRSVRQAQHSFTPELACAGHRLLGLVGHHSLVHAGSFRPAVRAHLHLPFSPQRLLGAAGAAVAHSCSPGRLLLCCVHPLLILPRGWHICNLHLCSQHGAGVRTRWRGSCCWRSCCMLLHAVPFRAIARACVPQGSAHPGEHLVHSPDSAGRRCRLSAICADLHSLCSDLPPALQSAWRMHAQVVSHILLTQLISHAMSSIVV